MLEHLVYVSTASARPTRDELLDLLWTSRRNNARDGVTGMLLYSGGTYMQVLEGEAEALDRTYARIALDPRHRVTQVLLREERPRRSFPEWTMGFRDVEDLTDAERGGAGPLLGPDGALSSDTDPARVHTLLRAFRTMAARDLG